MIFGNHFSENKAFGWYVKFGQTENVFSLIENSAKNDWNHFQSLFSLQSFSSSLSHAWVSHTRTASVKPSLLRPTHRAKQNDPHRRTTIAISPVTETTPIDVDHDRDRADRDRATRDLAIDASCDRDHADQRRSRSSKSARLRSRSHRSRAKRRLRSRSRSRDRDRGDCDRDLAEKHFSFLGFICVFRNEWHYVFVW